MTTTTRSARRSLRRLATGITAAALLTTAVPAIASAQEIPIRDMTPPDLEDPRYELEAGTHGGDDTSPVIDEEELAETVASNLDHVGRVDKPEYPVAAGAFDAPSYRNINSDVVFSGDYVYSGNYLGFGIYDTSAGELPELVATVQCRGGQGDLSIHGDLLFMSVESNAGQTDCSSDDDPDKRFRGVRIFDLSGFHADGDAASIRQVAAVQTCRGSHTNTLVEDPDDDRHVYVYVSGTSGVANRPGLDGCVTGRGNEPVEDDARFRIEIIKVPLSAPELSRIVAQPRIFAAGEGDDQRINGLWGGGDHGEGTQSTSLTDACHDITSYRELQLVAGACEGNGILFDVSDPEAPVRLDEVIDPNFAYWHSATFNNDGTKVVFTDEWGGGGAPRCRVTDPTNWGANAIFDIVGEGADRELRFASHYKIPNVQSDNEVCVAHNGNLIPVPGRDIMVQAWYEGGVSVFDFTDSADPVEIAFFDRGEYSADTYHMGGYWSVYWHNGAIYGNEIFLGLDTWKLVPSEFLSAEEIAAAEAVEYGDNNPQAQFRYESSFPEPEPDPEPEPEPTSVCDGVSAGFSDVDAAARPHGANIACAAGYGIAQGRADGTYGPASDVQRGQMASFLVRLLTVAGVELPVAPADRFSDDDGSTHEASINALAAVGIAQGRTDTSFDPNGSVTRGQMASFLVRTVEFATDGELSAPAGPFTDTAGSPHEANIDVAHDLGIAKGRTATTYDPDRDVRRDQMASFLTRTLEVLSDAGLTLTPRG